MDYFRGLYDAYRPAEDTEANAAAYRESQQQRYLERRIRESKRECAMLDSMGDKEGFDEAARRLKGRQAALKNFVSTTGRTNRVDRTQVVGMIEA